MMSTRVPALNKALAILRHLNGLPNLQAGVSEIALSLGLAKSHCFNILKTFQAEGWVRFDPRTRQYALSRTIVSDLSRLITSTADAQIRQELSQLSLITRLPCVLTRIEPDGSFMTIEKAEETAELLVSVPIGYRFPPDAPAQMRVRLAWSAPAIRQAAIDAWTPVRRTPATIVDPVTLAREIAATLDRGYAISRGEYTPGVMSLAVPIFDARGHLIMVLQTPGLLPDVAQREHSIAQALIACAGRLSGVIRV